MTTTLALSAGTWQLDPAASTATFRVGNLGRTVHGTVPLLEGTLEVSDDGRPADVHGSLDLGAIATGNDRRDKDLRKPSLLDLENHPTMTFASRTITPTETGWHVTGRLRVRNIAVPVSGDVTLSTTDPATATLTVTARFDRKPIGIRAPRLLIGRFIDVALTATVRAT
ncbi:polyisoprenoid-binding protein YceI [Kibdelosporangium banguiense]|uniref:Polyisoprenoid-binding protein YceI n=1 Tax=Kibdelosporangium banguiense TaxID=1365924 RepID=A0ABS4TL59_9PSEU|nr:YceI family protein [Kibdelosporangium banguiense]MBP2325150.1 polyisoprenoid-binding protein YceI [Kibdelosporangium banguiense]